jgi:hypothetical protein
VNECWKNDIEARDRRAIIEPLNFSSLSNERFGAELETSISVTTNERTNKQTRVQRSERSSMSLGALASSSPNGRTNAHANGLQIGHQVRVCEHRNFRTIKNGIMHCIL